MGVDVVYTRKELAAFQRLGIEWGKEYTKQGCYQQAFAFDPKDAFSWRALGGSGGGVVQGVNPSGG